MPESGATPPAKRSSFVATALAVLWSFVGIRKKQDYQQDAQQLKPVHVIVAGILGGVIFVTTIILIVRLVMAHAQP